MKHLINMETLHRSFKGLKKYVAFLSQLSFVTYLGKKATNILVRTADRSSALEGGTNSIMYNYARHLTGKLIVQEHEKSLMNAFDFYCECIFIDDAESFAKLYCRNVTPS